MADADSLKPPKGEVHKHRTIYHPIASSGMYECVDCGFMDHRQERFGKVPCLPATREDRMAIVKAEVEAGTWHA